MPVLIYTDYYPGKDSANTLIM